MAAADPDFDAPLRLYDTEVRPEWVDYNGHMSEAYYVLVFGYATDALLDLIGMDAGYRERNGMSLYTVEAHIGYLQEISEKAPLRVTTQLLDLDHKRAQVFHVMYHAENGKMLATEEIMLLNVDTRQSRTTPFPREIMERLEAIREAHTNNLPIPKQVGRSIGG